MYKIMIVDDEYWVRKRLVSTIEWSELGIDMVYEAQDGREALAIWQEHKPDIIITDINMPVINGIELMERLDEESNKPRVILISGYNEFEYARQGIKLGAVDYLLKPVDENELIRITKNCISEYENEKKKRETISTLEKNSIRFREKVILDLLTGRISNPESALLRLKQIGVDYSFSSAICVITHLSVVDQTELDGQLDQSLAKFSIAEIMHTVIPEHFKRFFVIQDEQLTIVILMCEESGDLLQKKVAQVLQSVQTQINQLFNSRLIFGIGSEVSNLLEIKESYKTARYAIYSNDYQEWDQVLHYTNTQKEDHKNEWLNLQDIYSDHNINSLNSHIRSGDRTAALEILEQIIDDFLSGSDSRRNPLQSKLFYINMMNTLFKNCIVSGPPSDESLALFVDSLDELESLFTPEKLRLNLEKIVDFLISQNEAINGSKRHWLIGNIMNYIQEHFSSSITMKDVANHFFLNPSYFCKLFKEETGVTFTHYLTKLRIEKAMDLLLNSTQKLYDIAAAVGYSNVQYFSTIFKEVTGFTPSQYRSDRHV